MPTKGRDTDKATEKMLLRVSGVVSEHIEDGTRIGE